MVETYDAQKTILDVILAKREWQNQAINLTTKQINGSKKKLEEEIKALQVHLNTNKGGSPRLKKVLKMDPFSWAGAGSWAGAVQNQG